MNASPYPRKARIELTVAPLGGFVLSVFLRPIPEELFQIMLPPGTVLQSRYRIVRQLGRGGMGTVYEAVDQRFGSSVAVKQTTVQGEVLLKAFEREEDLGEQ